MLQEMGGGLASGFPTANVSSEPPPKSSTAQRGVYAVLVHLSDKTNARMGMLNIGVEADLSGTMMSA